MKPYLVALNDIYPGNRLAYGRV